LWKEKRHRKHTLGAWSLSVAIPLTTSPTALHVLTWLI
jgi:hypothetical protein